MDNGRSGGRTRLGLVLEEPAPVYAHIQLPHPLDFEWRFTESTITSLWQLAHVLAGDREKIILLGTPSLAKRAAERPVWSGPVLLFDKNKNAADLPNAKGRVEEIEFDILHDTPSKSNAALVFADPPWYEDELKSFLWSSTALCGVGGHVAMSIPPLDTRPGIAEERVRIEQVARTFGLRPVRIFPSVLSYETPFFEANAMRAAGVSQPNDWRRGDLALYLHEGHFLGPRPVLSVGPRWTERTIRNSRIRMKDQEPPGSGSPILREIVPGSILPSVSRRDSRRAHVDVWTSGNRVLR